MYRNYGYRFCSVLLGACLCLMLSTSCATWIETYSVRSMSDGVTNAVGKEDNGQSTKDRPPDEGKANSDSGDPKHEPVGETGKGEQPVKVESKQPDAKGRTVYTYYSGYELIRENYEEEGKRKERLIITGNAVIRNENTYLYAPRIILEDNTIGRCEGGATIVDEKNGIRIQSEQALYDRSLQTVKLSGNPTIRIAKKQEKPVFGSATLIARKLDEEVTFLDGDVRFFQGEYSVVGDKGIYTDKDDTFRLEKDIMAFARGQFLSGNVMTYNTKSEIMIVENKVVLYSVAAQEKKNENKDRPIVDAMLPLDVYFRNGFHVAESVPKADEKKKKASPEGPTIVSAANLRSTGKNDGKNGGRAYSFEGDVILNRSAQTVKSNRLSLFGEGLKQIEAPLGGTMDDTDERSHVESGYMYYDQALESMKLDKIAHIVQYKQDSNEEESHMHAYSIVKNGQTQKTSAFGNVDIRRGHVNAKAESAEYYEDKDIIVMEGSPRLLQKGGYLDCDRIYIYPERKKVLFHNRIGGEFGKKQESHDFLLKKSIGN